MFTRLYLRGVHYTFFNYGRMSNLTLGNVFSPAPKHMIRLSVEYQQDSKILIRLWKSLVRDTPSISTFIYVFLHLIIYLFINLCIYLFIYLFLHLFIYVFLLIFERDANGLIWFNDLC